VRKTWSTFGPTGRVSGGVSSRYPKLTVRWTSRGSPSTNSTAISKSVQKLTKVRCSPSPSRRLQSSGTPSSPTQSGGSLVKLWLSTTSKQPRNIVFHIWVQIVAASALWNSDLNSVGFIRLDALAWSVIATATWLAGWLAGWLGGCLSQPVLYQND